MRKLLQLVSTALIVCTMFTGKALAAVGEIVWTNPTERLAKLERTDDGSFREYVVLVPMDCLDGYVPVVGDQVNFSATPGRRAFEVDYVDPPKAR